MFRSKCTYIVGSVEKKVAIKYAKAILQLEAYKNCGFCLTEVAMKVIRTDQVPKQRATSSLFTGGPVTLQPIVTQQMGKYFGTSLVNFSKGARNKFHSHTSDQVLIVTTGAGIVATEQEELVVRVGDIIYIPAGEKHWHGATKDSEFSHIYVVSAGSKTAQLED